MADILLATVNAKYVHPSLALRLLRANLGELEDRSEIIEFALRQPLEEKVEAILAARPRLLALSVSIWNHAQTLDLLRALSERWDTAVGGADCGATCRPIIVLGGPEASNLPPDAPLLRPPFLTSGDYLIRGEGEFAFVELCRAVLSGRPPATSPAIAASHRFRADGPTVVEAVPVDLARIDPGYRLYTAEDLSHKLVYVEASRGCPFGCEFCLSSLDRRVREFPLDAFLHEMDLLIARGAKAFKFLDRTFNLDADHAGRIMDFFLDRLNGKPGAQPAPQGLYVHFEMVPARFPAALRERLTRFPPGSLRLEVGIQTFNAEVAARIGPRERSRKGAGGAPFPPGKNERARPRRSDRRSPGRDGRILRARLRPPLGNPSRRDPARHPEAAPRRADRQARRRVPYGVVSRASLRDTFQFDNNRGRAESNKNHRPFLGTHRQPRPVRL